MKCIQCLVSDTKVIDSRDTTDKQVRRRRQCLTCAFRFTSYEITDVEQVFKLLSRRLEKLK